MSMGKYLDTDPHLSFRALFIQSILRVREKRVRRTLPFFRTFCFFPSFPLLLFLLVFFFFFFHRLLWMIYEGEMPLRASSAISSFVFSLFPFLFLFFFSSFFFVSLRIAYARGKLLKCFSPFCISIMKSYCRSAPPSRHLRWFCPGTNERTQPCDNQRKSIEKPIITLELSLGWKKLRRVSLFLFSFFYLERDALTCIMALGIV